MLKAMLADTFEEIHFKKTGSPPPCLFLRVSVIDPKKKNTKTKVEPVEFWNSVENRQKLLRSFADKMKFDPMVAENWRNRIPQLRAFGVIITTTPTTHHSPPTTTIAPLLPLLFLFAHT